MDRTLSICRLMTLVLFLVFLSFPGIFSQTAPGNPLITSPTANTVEEGSVTFTCQSTGGTAPVTVHWYKNNVLVDTSSFTQTVSGVNVYTNVFTTDLQFSDKQAVFKCQVENSATSTPLTATKLFSDLYVPPFNPVLLGPSSVTADVSESWTCSTNRSYPVPAITWKLDSSSFLQGFSMSISQNSDATYRVSSVLTFTPLSSDHGKVLMCEIQHSQTSSSMQRTRTLQLAGTPTISVTTSGYTITEGGSVTLSVTVTNAATVTWTKTVSGGTPTTVSTSSSKYSGSTASIPSLTIISGSYSDQASYQCTVQNSAGSSVAGASITVTYSAPSTSVTPSTSTVTSGSAITLAISQSAYNVSSGSTVTLNITVSASPAITSVTWYRVSPTGVRTNVSIDGLNYGGATLAAPSLVIYNVDSVDSGSYMCVVSNGQQTDESGVMDLTVRGSIPSVSIAESAYDVIQGNDAMLQCSASASPGWSISTVYWQRTTANGATTTLAIDGRYSGGTVTSPSLGIGNVNNEDEGNYICNAVNSIGIGQSGTITLSVIGSPTVDIGSQAYSTTVGSTVTLTCTVSGSPVATSVSWNVINTSGSTTIQTTNSNKYSGSTISSPSLVIFNAATSDAGSYTCYATNSVGTGQSPSTTLTVGSASTGVPTVSVDPLSYGVSSGSTVTLSCAVTSSTTVTSVYWTRGGSTTAIVINNGKYTGSSTSSPSLTILNTATSDSGTYTCYATNSAGAGNSQAATLTVSGGVPTVTITTNTYYVASGQSVTLACQASGSPSVTSVAWQRTLNGATTTLAMGTKYSVGSMSNPSLTINNVGTSDYATYYCRATNTVGTTSSSGINVLSGSVPTVTITTNTYYVPSGQSVTLACQASGSPSITSVVWQRTLNGATTTLAMGTKYSVGSMSNPSLTINNVGTNDYATYYCRATNAVGTTTSSGINVVSGSVPTVSITTNTYYVASGQSVTLACQASGSPSVTSVAWQRTLNGATTTLAMGTKYSVGSMSNPSLTINNVGTNDYATYYCRATNAVGTTTSSGINIVSGSVPTVSITTNTYYVASGQSVTLACQASGSPSVTSVAWQRTLNGATTTLTMGSKYSVGSMSNPSLTINNVGTSDYATYYCRATNAVGTTTSSGINVVSGSVPTVSITTNTYYVASGQSVTLACQASGSPSVTSVAWQRTLNGATTTLAMGTKYSVGSMSNPSLTINNVGTSDYATYYCRATNAVGTTTSSGINVVSGSVPTVSITTNTYYVASGQSVTLACQTSGSPSVTSVAWQRTLNGATTTLTMGSKYSVGSMSNPSLTINNVGTSDYATYYCRATNAVGTTTSSGINVVSGSVPTVSITTNTYYVASGQSVTLACQTSGSPSVTSVAWQRTLNGATTTLTMGSKYSVGSMSNPSLTINNVGTSDYATYYCRATNAVGTTTSSGINVVSGSVPTVSITTNTYYVASGQSVTLACQASGSPSVTSVAWQRTLNGATTTLAMGTKYSVGSMSNPSLTINNVGTSDYATYYCRATNTLGTSTSNAINVLSGSVPTVTITTTTYYVVSGQSVTLACQASGSPSVTSVAWQRTLNGATTTLAMGTKYSVGSMSNPSLTINNVGTSDYATYYCRVTNAVGTTTSTGISVTSGNTPMASIGTGSYAVVMGSSVTIPCTVSGNPSVTSVAWEFIYNSVTTTLTIDGTNYGGALASSPALVIYNTDNSDQGYYKCTATNIVGTGRSSATYLYVTGTVPVVTIGQSEYSVLTADSITIGCAFSASPAVTSIEWQRTVNGVTTGVNIDGTKFTGVTVNSPSLTITNAQSSDQGDYRCLATNAAGTGQSSTAMLHVTGNLPVLVIGQSTYSVTTGQAVTLSCSVSATPAISSLSWTKVRGVVTTAISTSGSTKYSGGTINNPSLTIASTEENDEAYYYCQATNAVGTGESSQAYVSVTGSVPVAVIGQSTYSVTTGQSVTLVCSVSAIPAVSTITWKISDTGGHMNTLNVNGVKYTGGTTGIPSLTIVTTAKSDQRYYMCSATNSIGTGDSQMTYLYVTGDPPTVITTTNSYDVITGQSVTLACEVSGNPSVTSVAWKRTLSGATTTLSIDGLKYSVGSMSNPSLTINNAGVNDHAVYFCTATNAVDTTASNAIYVVVSGNVPVVTANQNTYSVTTGDTITLHCAISAVPSATAVQWQRTINGVTSGLNINGVDYGGSSLSSPSLVVYSTSITDTGTYVCKATNLVGTAQSVAIVLSVTGAAPTVTIGQAAYSVTTGSAVTLTCTLSGIPAATIVRWKKTKNGVTSILSIDNSKYSGGAITSPSLVISNTDASDEGTYVCLAQNSVGIGTSPATTLTVTGSIPTVTIPQSSYSVITGNSVTLQCTLSASPIATAVTWKRVISGATDVVNVDGNKYTGSTVNIPSLTINSAASGDGAAYICTVTNVVGVGESTPIVLTVTGDVPTVTVGSPTYTVMTGSSVTLDCTITATPPASAVYWQRDISGTMTTINIDGANYFGGSLTTPSLSIQSATASDQGYYTCMASNEVGTGHSGQTYLTVAGGTPLVSIPQQQYTVVTSNSITITCTVSSSPAATGVTWQRIVNNNASDLAMDGVKLIGGTVSVPSLTITDAASTDQGYYVCMVTNAVGTGQSTQTYLTVTGHLPVVVVSDPQYSVIQGHSVTLQCTVSASPAISSVSWERIISGVATTLTIDGQKFSGAQVQNPDLVINGASTSDEGSYVCTAINSVGIGRSAETSLDVTGNVPVVTISAQSYSVVMGNSRTLGCTYTSSPSATSLKWERVVNGAASAITADGSKYGGGSLSSLDLTIYSAAASDQAYYQCVVTNGVGDGTSAQTYLYVTGNVPSVTAPQTTYSVGYENTVTLGCTVSSTPSATSITWEHHSNGVTSTVTIGGGYQGGTVSSPSLVIAVAQFSDQGSYYCKVMNSIGTGTSPQIYLYVTGSAPTITLASTSYSVATGGSVSLACSVAATPALTDLYWTKNGATSRITIANSYSGATTSDPSLGISSLQSSHSGSYRCHATNSIGTTQSNAITLLVTYQPQNTAVSPTTLTVSEGGTISATCSSDGQPTPTYRWVKVSNSQEYSTTSALSVSSIDRGHDGVYRCTATNSQGTPGTADLTVTVEYRPVSTVSSADQTVTLANGQSQVLLCSTVANPAVTSHSWTKDDTTISGATSQSYTVTISATGTDNYGTYSCYATNPMGTSNAIPFTVSSGTTTGASAGASTASTGLTTGTIAAMILAILFILLVIILVICCCCMKGVCGEWCGGGKKKKKIVPHEPEEPKEPIYEPKEIIRTIEIPRYVEKPVYRESFYREPIYTEPVYREPAHREPAHREPAYREPAYRESYRESYREPSAVSRRDVIISEENFDITKYQTIPPAGTSYDGGTVASLEHYRQSESHRTPRGQLPALEYHVEAPVTVDNEERQHRRRSKKKRRRHREAGDGVEEREYRSTSRRRHRHKRRGSGEEIITNGDIYYKNYSTNADNAEQYYYN